MLEWVTETLQAAAMGPTALPLAFLLGLVSAVASACCTLPAMGMLVAYSGTRQDVDRRSSLLSAVWFLIGTTMALVILGFVAGLIGQAAQAFLGRYWKLFAGLAAVFFGLATLKLLPFKLPSRSRKEGITQGAEGGWRDTCRRWGSAGRCRIVLVGHILRNAKEGATER